MDRAVLETSSDRYVIVEYLAEGGMGAIYLGKKLGVGGFEKEVVLKQLLPEFTQEPKFIDLFLREARLSASLEHANIVHTIDLVNAGDDYFMVMEYVKGADLRTLLKRVRRKHKRFSPQAGVFIGHEILEALAYAHQKSAHDGRPLNLIHRDISPSNILLSGAGEVKLTDFGIAKASTHRSVFYKVKGKVGYMSPEQARGEPVDARSDLFSLGVVLYEVLVGERLFVGDIMSSASQIYAQPIKAPSNKRPEIPADLDAVILKSLSLDPAGRYQSAEEFQEALTRVATRHRLLVGASEMSAHLKQIAGEDAATWLKLEVIGHDRGEPTQAHGTSVLSSAEDEEAVSRPKFDLSDDDDADEDDEVDDNSDVDDLLRARNRPPSLPTGELTSVIAVRKKAGESEMLTKVKEGEVAPRWKSSGADEPPLQPLQPKRSEPIPAASTSAPRRVSTSKPVASAHKAEFGNEESRAQTKVRDPSPRNFVPPPPARTPLSPPQRTSQSAPQRTSQSAPQRTSQSAPQRTSQSAPQRTSQPPPSRGGAPVVGDETLVHPGSQAGFARPHAKDGAPQMTNPLGGSPLVASSNTVTPGSTRRLPTSGIRQRPAGEVFNGTAYIRRPRRIIGIMIVLLLIGIGVALGVAFSGPELEVIDPMAVPSSPGSAASVGTSAAPPAGTAGAASGAAPTGAAPTGAAPAGAAPAGATTPLSPSASPSAAPALPSTAPAVPAAPRQTPAASELPGPPSPNPGTP